MMLLGLELVGKVVVTTPNTNSCFEPEYSCTSGKNHFHEMNGDIGMAGWK